MARVVTTGVQAPVESNANGQLGPPPRRSPLSRVRGSLALAVVFAVLAGLFYLLAASGGSGESIAVAARDLRAGEALDAGVVRYVEVSGAPAFMATLLGPEDLAQVNGFVLTHAITEGSPIGHGDLVSPAAGAQARSMSIPVEDEHAAGGAIGVGDIVDVIDGGENGVAPSYAVTGVQVVAVSAASDGTLGSSGNKSWIAVALPDGPLFDGQAALRLAAAIQHGKVEVVRSTGAPPLPASAVTSLGGR